MVPAPLVWCRYYGGGTRQVTAWRHWSDVRGVGTVTRYDPTSIWEIDMVILDIDM